MTTETFLMVLITNLFSLGLSTLFYASRVDELRREHAQRVENINHDTLMWRRVQSEVSIEDVLGRTEDI